MPVVRIEDASGKLIQEVDIQSWKNLLRQLEKADVDIPNACRIWTCAACLCTIEKGSEFINKELTTAPAFPLGDDEVMTCIAGVDETEEIITLRTMI